MHVPRSKKKTSIKTLSTEVCDERVVLANESSLDGYKKAGALLSDLLHRFRQHSHKQTVVFLQASHSLPSGMTHASLLE